MTKLELAAQLRKAAEDLEAEAQCEQENQTERWARTLTDPDDGLSSSSTEQQARKALISFLAKKKARSLPRSSDATSKPKTG